MDTKKLDTRSAAAAGAFYHLLHPGFDPKHPIYEGEGADEYGRLTDRNKPHKPVGVHLRGIEAKTVAEAFRSVIRAQEEAGGVETEALREKTIYFLMQAIIRFDGLERDGKPLKSNPDDIEHFLELSTDFGAQIIKFCGARANFFGKQKG